MEKAQERLIFHIDVNSAFVSWEAARRVRNGLEDIRLIPSVIGGDPNSRASIVAAKSIPAKKYGINTGEPVSMAIRKCPELLVAEPDFNLYKSCSKAFIEICREYAPIVEQFSIDECFMDMTGTDLLYPDPVKTAYEIKDKIKNELGFTVNIGISRNKLLAKMASDFEKPDKVHTLFPEEIKKKMWPLPVGDLFLAGKSTQDRLSKAHIKTIGELAVQDITYIKSLLGDKMGEQIYRYANGIDDSPVSDEREDVKSYSMSTTLESDVVSYDEAYKILMILSDRVSARMRRDEVKAFCISVTIRSNTFRNRSHQRKLENATDISKEIYETAKSLFDELWDGKTPLRLLNVGLSNVTKEEIVQLSLFDDEKKEKSRSADKTMDEIRDRFGSGIISRGSVYEAQKDVKLRKRLRE